MSRKVDMEKLLISGRNLIAAEMLCNEIGNTKERILDDKLVPVLEKFAKDNKLTLNYDTAYSKRFSGFYFARSSWDKKYNIGFEFQEKNYNSLIFGIHLIDGKKPSASPKEQEQLHKLFSDSKKNKTKYWPWWSFFDDDKYNNWNAYMFISIYNNPNEIANLLIDKTSEILEKIDSMKL